MEGFLKIPTQEKGIKKAKEENAWLYKTSFFVKINVPYKNMYSPHMGQCLVVKNAL